MSVTALVTLWATALAYSAVEPATAGDDLIGNDLNSEWLFVSALGGAFLAGATCWRPAGILEPLADRIWLIATLVGHSFWLSGLIAGFALVFTERPVGSFIIGGPILLAIGGAMIGPWLFGPLAYPIAVAILWPLRRLESRTSTPVVDTATRFRRCLRGFFGALTIFSAGLAFLAAAVTLVVLLIASATRLTSIIEGVIG